MASTHENGVLFSNMARQNPPEMVIVEVGPKHTKYFIHNALLVRYSQYFQNMLAGPWKEAEEKVILLDDVEEQVFSLFVEWLYTLQLPGQDDAMQHICDVEGAEMVDYYLVLAKAYVFADRIVAPMFQNETQDAFTFEDIVLDTGTDFSRLVDWCFANIDEESPMLQFLVDKYVESQDAWEDEFSQKLRRGHLPRGFLFRVIRRYAEVVHDRDYGVEHEGNCIRCYKNQLNEDQCCGNVHMTWYPDLGVGDFVCTC